MDSSLIEKFPVMTFFKWEHLPSHLQAVSRPFGELAVELATRGSGLDTVSAKIELSVALRKLLEAKDAAVRAALS